MKTNVLYYGDNVPGAMGWEKRIAEWMQRLWEGVGSVWYHDAHESRVTLYES